MKNQKQNRQHSTTWSLSHFDKQGIKMMPRRRIFSSERFGFSQFSSSSFYSSVVQNSLKCVCAMVLAVLHAEICTHFVPRGIDVKQNFKH